MNEGEDGFIKCPRCGGEMEEGDKLVGFDGVATHFFKYGEFSGDRVVPFYCRNCGYIELYKKKELAGFFERHQKKEGAKP